LEIDESHIKGIANDKIIDDKYWNNLTTIFFDNEFWMDQLDHEEIVNIDKRQLVLEYHELLKPLWEQFKASLIDYKNEIIPMRKSIKTLSKVIEVDKSTEYYKYKDLLKQSNIQFREQFYDITVNLKVSFDSGHISFYKRKIDIINNFLNILNEIPISILSQCNHCNKFIVMTRSDKQYCPGCAAKKYQKDQWKDDPEGMKRKEKMRYHTKRKLSD
jgi:ACT domain-containing protein